MPKNRNKIILFLLTAAFLISWAAFVLAQGPEIHYPWVPGKSGGYFTITSTESISITKYIKYLFNLSSIIATLIAFGALIYGGFLYLTSAGNPTAVSEAKKYITNALLGLIIILGAFVLLNTMNPRLTILRVVRKPTITRGVVLKDANGRIVTLSSSVANLGNFSPTQYKYIGGEDMVDATVYLKENYASTSRRLPYEADYAPLLTSNLTEVHSIEIKGLGMGIYLYANNLKESRGPFTQSIGSLGVYDFNQKAQWIKITDKNKRTGTKEDYMAIAFSDKNYSGTGKIFFQKRDVSNLSASLFQKCDSETDCHHTCSPRPPKSPSYPCNPTSTCGDINDVAQLLVPIRGNNKYGSIDSSISSLAVYRLNLNSPDSCTVHLYSGVEFNKGSNSTNNSTDNHECTINKFILEPQVINNNVCKTPNFDWNDKIRSIKVEGKCIVVLFEHLRDNGKDACWSQGSWWAGQGFSGKTEIFTSNPGFYPDLTADPIGSCNYNRFGFGISLPQPCASSIAIYPIK